MIRVFRKSKKLTQWELAREIGCTENYVWMIENCKRLPSPVLLNKVSQILDVNPEWLKTLLIRDMINRFDVRVNKGRY